MQIAVPVPGILLTQHLVQHLLQMPCTDLADTLRPSQLQIPVILEQPSMKYLGQMHYYPDLHLVIVSPQDLNFIPDPVHRPARQFRLHTQEEYFLLLISDSQYQKLLSLLKRYRSSSCLPRCLIR